MRVIGNRVLQTVLAVCLWAAPAAAQNPATSVSVDASANRHPISPNIYGFAFGATSDLSATNFTVNRSGGNSTSTYNWQLNATNHDNDWYFESILDSPETPGYDGDNFISTTRAAGVGAQAMLTIPMIGYLANLGTGGATLWSFSVHKYGAQTGTDPYQPDAGNGISAATNKPITGNNPLDANIPNQVSTQQAWIQHLIGTWGLAASGGLQYYIMDNEPSLWSSTHRDIHPAGETYNELLAGYQSYAAAVRALDSNALIVGPEEWGWWAMFLSGLDQANGTGNAGPDYNSHGQTYYYPWLLQQLYSYQQSTGTQLLNVLSVHYYPQELSNSDDDSPSGQQTRNQSTRVLWDSHYVDPSWLNQVGINGGIVNLIPTLKGWVNQYYPGLQTAITEYNWGDEANLNGATTQADVLGIFGREGLDLATRWTVPANPSPTYLALKMYRNYDGSRSTFGDTSVSAAVANPDNLSAFAAVRSSDGALTVMVINKQTGSTPVTVSLANFASTGTAQAWQVSSAGQAAIGALGSVAIANNAIATTVPSQSITLFVIPAGSVTSPPTAPTGLAATVGSGTVTLTWNAGGGATTYTVKRGTLSGGPYTTLGSVPDSTPTYADNGLTNGETYYYVVTGTNSAGTSPNSGELAATPIVPPVFTSTASASPNPVSQGASTTIQASVTCTSGSLVDGNIQLLVLDPNGNTAATQNYTGQNFGAQQNTKYSFPFTPSLAGTYTVEVGVFSATWQQWNWNASAATITVNLSLTFSSSATAPASVAPGGTAAISVTVTDSGTTGLTNANVELQIFNSSGTAVATQVWSGQNFTAGASLPYSYSWITAASLPTGSYSVDLGVFDGGWTHDYYWNTDATITVTSAPPPASLRIAKSHSGAFTQAQSGAVYTVTVSNAAAAGPTSGAVTVTETVPAGLTLAVMSGTGWTCPLPTCTRSDALQANTSYPPITVTVNVAANASSPQVNSVSVTGGGSPTASTTDSTVITPLTPVTIQTSPTGLQFAVDGAPAQTAPQTVSLAQGPHTIAVVATQPGATGTQYLFTSWSDAGAPTHSITVSASSATYTATFKTQYQLTLAASPTTAGTVTPPTGIFYDAATVVPIAATPNTGYTFNNWSGAVAAATNASTSVTMTSPLTVTADFSSLTGISIQTTPPNLQFTIDGGPAQTAPQTVNLSQGSHTLSVATTQPGPTGTQYAFTNWSDTGAPSHTITVTTSPATYTATFKTQYQLTLAASPTTAGTVTPPTGTFYDSATVVPIAATPNTSYTFTTWSGPVANATNAATTVTMNSTLTVTANFSSLTGITIQTAPPNLQFAIDGGPAQTAPQTLTLSQGPHALSVATTQPGATGTQYIFTNWSDTGAASHTITVTASPATYTATFTTQYLLTTSVSPTGAGTVTASGYYNSGAAVQLTASPTAGYQFINWSGDFSGAANPEAIAINAPYHVAANFSSLTAITIQTTPPNLQFSIDGGTPQTAPQTLTLSQGPHTLSVATTQSGATGTQYVFINWSDTGAPSHTITVTASPSTYTATFKTQYQLTLAASPTIAGTVTPPTGTFYDAATVVPIAAAPNTGYTFNTWSGPVANATNPSTSVTMTSPVSVTANFSSLTGITIQTVPPNLQFTIDGGPAQTAPQSLTLSQGPHTLSVATTQPGATGTQYIFTNWSDTGTASHTITVTASPSTYTATFKTQYQLTLAASPSTAGTVTPPTGTFYDAATITSIAAAPNTGYTFNTWSGPAANATNPSTSVTMTSPVSVTANFSSLTAITIQTVPPNLQFTIDGGPAQTAPQSLNLSQGPHILSVASTQPGATGTQYIFNAWSDTGAPTHTITVTPSPATYTATFATQYLLTTVAAPTTAGSVTASGYYNSGATIQLTASPAAGYQFTNWTGDLSGATNPQSIAINAPYHITANFTAVTTTCALTFSPAASLPVTGTSSIEICPNNSAQPNCGVMPETPQSFTVTPTTACVPWTATSSNPEFLQITSGASGSGAGTVAFTLLNNTHTTPQSYTISVSSAAAAASYAITQAGSADSQFYREVYALYEQLLGRDPDSSGFAFWTGTGGAGLGEMADSFLTSPEAFNSGFAVMAIYQAATGTAPTFGQYTAGVAAIRAETQSVTGLFTSLASGSYTVANLYQNLLNRAPAAGEISEANQAGLANWFQTLIGYPNSTTPVGTANNEFQSTGTYTADHTNALYVRQLYYVTLGRDPDAGGLNYWVGVANAGGHGLLFQGSAGYNTRIQILGSGAPNEGFIGSPEFQALFAN